MRRNRRMNTMSAKVMRRAKLKLKEKKSRSAWMKWNTSRILLREKVGNMTHNTILPIDTSTKETFLNQISQTPGTLRRNLSLTCIMKLMRPNQLEEIMVMTMMKETLALMKDVFLLKSQGVKEIQRCIQSQLLS